MKRVGVTIPYKFFKNFSRPYASLVKGMLVYFHLKLSKNPKLTNYFIVSEYLHKLAEVYEVGDVEEALSIVRELEEFIAELERKEKEITKGESQKTVKEQKEIQTVVKDSEFEF